jgi:hypothetical protein
MKSKKIKLNLGELVNIYLGGTFHAFYGSIPKWKKLNFADKQRSDKLLFEFEKISPILIMQNIRRHVLGMRNVKSTHFPEFMRLKRNKDNWSEDDTIFMAQYAKL